MKKQQASIVLLCLMVMSVIVLLILQLIRGVHVGQNFSKTMVNREHAEILALGGINIAIAQLLREEPASDNQSFAVKPENIAKSSGRDKKLDPDQAYLLKVLPHLNRWQDFQLKKDIDGIDGLVRVCITCEQGKININEAFDFKAMEFKKDYHKLLKGLEMPGKLVPGEIFNKITEYFKKRKKKLDDVSELLQVKELSSLDIFYTPPEKPLSKKQKPQPNSLLALQDIFTTLTKNDKVDPLWLSDALCAIFTLRRPLATDAVARKERYKKFAQTFKKDMVKDWAANWKVLEQLYDKKPKIIEEMKKVFTKEFGPKIFSVLSCGKVGNVEQYVVVVIQEQEVKDDVHDSTDKDKKGTSAEQGESQRQQGPKKFFKILRTYWL